MKTTMQYLSTLLLAVMLVSVSYAQTSPVQDQTDPRIVTDKTMTDRLGKDWSSRNANNKSSVQWYETSDGYYGTYNTGTVPYMTFYDREGKYRQSYKKADWNTVPPAIRSAYDASDYKAQEVTGFWQSADTNKKGYYLELKDDNGKTSRVWVDEKGQFSPTYKIKPTSE